jgi:uncharacterized protein with HEPN domain
MADRNRKAVLRIIGYVDKILDYCAGVSENEFMQDAKLADACAMNLIQIGELVNAIDADFAERHSNIPWNQIRGLRNRIVHGYEDLNFIRVWNVVTEDLPELKQQLEGLL